MADSTQLVELGIEGLGGAEHVALGSFADVYKAPHESLGSMVAVKILHTVVPEASARLAFERDCQVIAELSEHPHLVNLYTGGLTTTGFPYLVTDWLAGGSLAARLQRQGPLRPGRAIDLIAKVAEAVDLTHRAGVLHRDIKPSNILLTRDGEPALGDVGIARLEGRHQVASMRVPAGFLHTAPEVLEGHEHSEASDIYSLGSTIFEILVGRAAYFSPDDDSVWPLMKRALSQPFPDAAKLGAYEPFADLIRRATERNPADRFGSVSELLGVLRAMPLPSSDSGPSDDNRVESVAASIEPQGGVVYEEPVDVYEEPVDLYEEAGVQQPQEEQEPNVAEREPNVVEQEPNVVEQQHDAGLDAGFDGDVELVSTPGPPGVDRQDQWPTSVEQLADPANLGGRAESLNAALLRGTQPASGPASGISFEERIRALRDPGSRPPESRPSPELPNVSTAPKGPSAMVPALPPAEPPSGSGSAMAPDAAVGEPAVERSGSEQELHDLLSEKPKKRQASSAGSSDNAALRGILIGLLAAAVLGGLLWQFWLSDRSSTVDQNFSGPAITLVESANGPLEAGQPYAVTIADSVGPDASYRFVVDGSPVGEPAASPPSHIALAGRHELQLEVTSAGTTSLSPPVSYYAMGPTEAGYRAHLAVVEANSASWPQALDIYDALASDGHQLELLVSDRIAGVSPGRWMIAVGGFGSNGADADAYCAESSLASPEQCWAGFVEANSGG